MDLKEKKAIMEASKQYAEEVRAIKKKAMSHITPENYAVLYDEFHCLVQNANALIVSCEELGEGVRHTLTLDEEAEIKDGR